jgi:hypothetical protein
MLAISVEGNDLAAQTLKHHNFQVVNHLTFQVNTAPGDGCAWK